MSQADLEPDPPRASPLARLATAGIVVAALALLVQSIFVGEPHRTSSLLGQPAPAIQAAGWLNGDPPSDDYFQGKVVVVDAWAYWCRPCFDAAPELIALHKQYADRGVVFVGLTTEAEDAVDRSRQFLEQAGIPWLNGYGAGETLIALEAHTIPQVWVIDRNGVIVWDESASETIESALDRALAKD